MRCPFCGKHSDGDICPFCGMDKRIADKIRHTADRFYRAGYQAACINDLYTAECNLKKALYYNGEDTRTLNLLGLVYNRTGQIGEALKLWQKSVSLDERRDNRAWTYLDDVRKRASRLAAKEEAVRLYNEALEQARAGSLDFAIARLKKAGSLNKHNVKAHLLLSLCYIEQKRYNQALSALEKAARMDPFHPLVARYRSLIAGLAEQGIVDAEDEDVQDVSESHGVRAGLTEPDMTEIFGSGKGRRVRLRNWHQTLSQIGMFILGAACMFAFIYTLKIPDEVIRMREETASMQESVQQMEEATEQMQQDLLKARQYQYDAEQANVSLKKEVEDLTKELQEAVESNVDDALAQAVITYLNGDYMTLLTDLSRIDRDLLTESGRTLYDTLEKSLDYVSDQMYQSGYEDFMAAQDAEGEEQKQLLQAAEKKLTIALRNSEEETNQWYMARYYYGCVRYWQEEYQEALAVAQDLIDRYEHDDDYSSLIHGLYEDASAALQEESDNE